MRCIACNKNLSDFESTRKNARTGEFIDMCTECFETIKDDFNTIDRPDLDNVIEDDIEESNE
jgi:hypothetical protein